MADDETTAAERDRTVGEIVEERLLAIEEKLGLGQFKGAKKAKADDGGADEKKKEGK